MMFINRHLIDSVVRLLLTIILLLFSNWNALIAQSEEPLIDIKLVNNKLVSGHRNGVEFKEALFKIGNILHRVEAFEPQSCGFFQWPNNEIRKKRNLDNLDLQIVGNNASSPAIIGSKRMTNADGVQLKQFPSYVKLEMMNLSGRKWNCGGTIVARDMIVTAAHCVHWASTGIKFVNVRAGFVAYDNQSRFDIDKFFKYPFYKQRYPDHSQIANGAGVCLHHNLQMADTGTVSYDLAVVQLDRKFNFNEYVQPACLLLDQKPGPNEELYGVGWGRTGPNDDDVNTNNLNYLKMKEVDCSMEYSEATCYKPIRKPSKICTGDSGSGLYHIHKGKQYLIGITSMGVTKGTSRNRCLKEDHDIAYYFELKKGWSEVLRLLHYCYEQNLTRNLPT